jgi:proline iminopeptidase
VVIRNHGAVNLHHPLSAAVLGLGAYLAFGRPRLRHWGATDEEVHERFPGDDLIAGAGHPSTMATSLPAPPGEVWPWLVQMGCDRAGWYSWDRLDNGGRPSADRIHPEWQDLVEGGRLLSVPSGATWFEAAIVDEPRTLVLRADIELPSGHAFDPTGPLPRAFSEGVWGFHLRPVESGIATRLVVRTWGRTAPQPLMKVVDVVLGEPAHAIMQTRQFEVLRRRVTEARSVSTSPMEHATEMAQGKST